jgi:glycosyltransferase involved in cell wall biosynthesis
MEIALFTPLPPQNTGIADYVFHWLEGMSADKNMAITLFSNTEADSLLGYPIKSITHLDHTQLTAFDLIIYHLGNNVQYHGYMLEIIKKHKGIIHLHDVVLHHLMAAKTYGEGELDAYLAMIEKHYGKMKRDDFFARLSLHRIPWEEDDVADFPLFEEFVQYADMCIVHSNYALHKIKAVFNQLPVFAIPQLYRLELPAENLIHETGFQIGVFGGVDSQKKVDVIIKALAALNQLQLYDFTLHIVGNISPSCEFVHTLPKQLAIEDKVIVHGRVDKETYMQLFNAVDLIIALRMPTMGETSAVVMQALQLTIPVIVTDIGWYSELPDFVDKIGLDNLEKNLEDTLLNYFSIAGYLENKVSQIKSHAASHFDFESYIANYKQILHYQYNLKLNKLLYKQFSQLFSDVDIINDDLLLTSCLTKIKHIF